VSRPGEVFVAHHGIAFVDEFPACKYHVLEILHEPLEDGVI
jgi:magnesium chelatase family protein